MVWFDSFLSFLLPLKVITTCRVKTGSDEITEQISETYFALPLGIIENAEMYEEIVEHG